MINGTTQFGDLGISLLSRMDSKIQVAGKKLHPRTHSKFCHWQTRQAKRFRALSFALFLFNDGFKFQMATIIIIHQEYSRYLRVSWPRIKVN